MLVNVLSEIKILPPRWLITDRGTTAEVPFTENVQFTIDKFALTSAVLIKPTFPDARTL
jgi:hypothetical protein